MKRILVIGCPGSGKSTFSRGLHRATGLPLVHLDQMNWNEDGTTVPREVFLRRLEKAIEEPSWIIDGNYGATMERRAQICDTVFFLDLPTEVCLAGIRSRKGQPRSDMPWKGADEDDDPEFVDFIRGYPTAERPRVLELLGRYPDKEIHIFTRRREMEEYLKTL